MIIFFIIVIFFFLNETNQKKKKKCEENEENIVTLSLAMVYEIARISLFKMLLHKKR